MTHCAKCGAELIGSRKFCAACGTPTVDLRGSGNPSSGTPDAYGNAPISQVNPFAQTAMPGAQREKVDSMYGPPPDPQNPQIPAVPSTASPVSPLAASNAVETRGAFITSGGAQVAAARAAAIASVDATKRAAELPGTQAMPSMQRPPSQPPSALASTAPNPSGGKKGGTQVMSSVDAAALAMRKAHPGSGVGSPLSSPAASTGEGPARQSPAVVAPSPAAPVAPIAQPVAPYPYAPSAVGPYVAPVLAPQQAPVPPPAPTGSPFYPGYPSYAPGSRVQVTWANGQRYPGTIHQLAGHQVLVVFPDGQQHWVDLQYVAPG